MMTTITATYGVSLTGVNYEIGWDPKDPFESDENFDSPWLGEYYYFGSIKDGEMGLPNRSSQLPPNLPNSEAIREQYNEGYKFGAWFKQVFSQF